MDILVDASSDFTARTVPSSLIVETLRRLNTRSNASPGRGVILPPRITRVASGGAERIRVVVLVRAPLPAGLTQQQRIDEVVRAVTDTLDDIEMPGTFSSGPMQWYPVTGGIHNPTVNGTIEFWTSGEAAQTRTRESAAMISLSAPDNPVGPNSAATQEQTPGELLGRLTNPDALDSVKEVLTIGAVVAIPVALAWGLSSASSIYLESRRGRRTKGGA